MPDTNTFLLKIMEGTRCVAEAPLIVYDKEAAIRNFYEGYPNVMAQTAAVFMAMMQRACNEVYLPGKGVGIHIVGNHSGLVVPDGELPPMSILSKG